MSRVVAIGNELRLAGYALAGAEVRHAASPAETLAAWESLAEDAGVLVLTPEAFAALERRLAERAELVWAVLPS
jgi:vacuolar-type H+-ATPase subunit F/Vma7